MPETKTPVCQSCQRTFTPEEDMVVCDQCGASYHTYCWDQNRQCTACGCETSQLYSPKAQTQTPPPPPSQNQCPYCGALISQTASFCTACGTNLKIESSGMEPWQIEAAQIQQFIQKGSAYYIDKHFKMKQQGSVVSWNWPAFLFSTYWFFYRKMYGWGFGLLGFGLLCDIFGVFSFIPALGVSVVMGLFGNHLYLKHVENHIHISDGFPPTDKGIYYAKKGGTSAAAVICVAAVYFIVAFIAAFAYIVSTMGYYG